MYLLDTYATKILTLFSALWPTFALSFETFSHFSLFHPQPSNSASNRTEKRNAKCPCTIHFLVKPTCGVRSKTRCFCKSGEPAEAPNSGFFGLVAGAFVHFAEAILESA
jgi:hypothetical protein